MKIKDIKIGDVLRFGRYNWFKADKDGVFITVTDIGSFAYGESRRDGDRHLPATLLPDWLNSADETFDLSAYTANMFTYTYRTYRDRRSGFLYEFEPDEQAALVSDVMLPLTSEIWGDNRLPLFKKMGIRIRNDYQYHGYWLTQEVAGWAAPYVTDGGERRSMGTTGRARVRPIIHIDPNLTVFQADDVLTPYSRVPKKTYEIDFSTMNMETVTYTDEDFASLFGLA